MRLALSNERLSHNEIVQNWRTVTIPVSFYDQIIIEQDDTSDSTFDIITSTGNFKQEDSAKNILQKSMCADNPDSMSDFVDAGNLEYSTATNLISLTDQQIITLAESIKITFPGLPDAKPGYNTILQGDNETNISFAHRKLVAITPPLLTLDDVSTCYLQKAIAINKWHEATFNTSNILDSALAETCYYVDHKNSRFVIRHTPMMEDTPKNKADSAELQRQVTSHLKHYEFSISTINSTIFKIHHLVPCIQKGYPTLHIILKLTDEVSNNIHTAKLDPKIEIPGLSFLYASITHQNKDPNYHYLSVQSTLNNSDCGRYITIIAVAATRLLSANVEQSIKKMTLDDFKPFLPYIQEAPRFQNCKKLKELLSQTEYQPINSKNTKEKLDHACQGPENVHGITNKIIKRGLALFQLTDENPVSEVSKNQTSQEQQQTITTVSSNHFY